jgi:CspA family cold shock protein
MVVQPLILQPPPRSLCLHSRRHGGTIKSEICISAPRGYREKVNIGRLAIMAKGTVKWFNATKGYGFIQPQGGGGKDVFVHISAVERAGLSTLNEGQIVEYEEVSNKGKTSAENLRVQR